MKAINKKGASTGRYILLAIVVIAIVIGVVALEKTKSKVAQGDIKKTEVAVKTTDTTRQTDAARISKKEALYPKAVELVDPDGYLNTDKITIADNIGKKIILVDFWTYSCINCQRTIPYLNGWYQKYKDKGLLIIGVHTPEFEFEHDKNNVQRAIEKFGIKYPVVQDNEYKTWTAYSNHYWPRKYIIDIDGYIVYDHIGEGGYEETEAKIQELLQERDQVLNLKEDIPTNITKQNEDKNLHVFNTEGILATPEIYFGYQYARNQLGNEEGWQPNKVVSYTLPSSLKKNDFYLSGDWLNNNDNMEFVGDQGTINLHWYGKEIHLVAGARTPNEIEYAFDGKESQKVTIDKNELYTLLKEDKAADHNLVIKVKNKGLMAYTFTFG